MEDRSTFPSPEGSTHSIGRMPQKDAVDPTLDYAKDCVYGDISMGYLRWAQHSVHRAVFEETISIHA